MNPIDRALEALRACRAQLDVLTPMAIRPTQVINAQAARILADQAIYVLEQHKQDHSIQSGTGLPSIMLTCHVCRHQQLTKGKCHKCGAPAEQVYL